MRFCVTQPENLIRSVFGKVNFNECAALGSNFLFLLQPAPLFALLMKEQIEEWKAKFGTTASGSCQVRLSAKR